MAILETKTLILAASKAAWVLVAAAGSVEVVLVVDSQ